MWLKITAGVVAALAVVTVGVFVSLPSTEGGCGGKCHAPAPKSDELSAGDVSGQTECHLGLALSAESHAVAPCCNVGPAKTVDTNALAACTGGMTVSVAPTAKFHCCDE